MPIIVVAAAATSASIAWAHAFPSGEEPRVGSTVTTSPSEVVIKFDNPIESLFAKLEVTDDAGHDMTNGKPERSDDQMAIKVPLKPLVPGDYHVKWSVVAEDGHRTEGSYMFTVAGGS